MKNTVLESYNKNLEGLSTKKILREFWIVKKLWSKKLLLAATKYFIVIIQQFLFTKSRPQLKEGQTMVLRESFMIYIDGSEVDHTVVG